MLEQAEAVMPRGSMLLVRSAGAPYDALELLDCPRAVTALTELEALEREIDSARQPLCDALFAKITGLADREARRSLIALKRSVYNRRRLASGAVDGIAHALQEDGSLRALVERWTESMARLERLRSELEAVLRDELAMREARLREAWRSPEFLTGLLGAQPDLVEPLLGSLTHTPRFGPKRVRHLHLTALAYWVRMATKTSPFSTFTATAVARWGEGAEDSERPPHPRKTVCAFTLNASLVERLAARACLDPEVSELLSFVPNPTAAEVQGGSLLTLRRIRTGAAFGAARVEERFSEVKLTPAVRDALGTSASSPGRLDELAALLARGSGPTVTAWRAMVDRCVSAGLLEPRFPFASNDPDALLQLASALRSLGSPRTGEWASRLHAVARHLQALDLHDPSAQCAVVRKIGAAVSELLESLGDAPLSTLQGQVYQDVYVDERSIVPARAFERFEGDLERVAAAVPLFNPVYLLRALVQHYVATAYGAARVPLTRFLRDFYRDVYEPHLSSMARKQPDPFSVPAGLRGLGFEPLAEARASFVDGILDCAAGSIAPVRLPGSLLDGAGLRAARYWPAELPVSVTWFAQLAGSGAGGMLVLNQVAHGYGAYMSRYTKRQVPNGAPLAQCITRQIETCADVGEWVEVAATFGFEGQIRAPITRRYICYPGEAIASDQQVELPWAQLAVGLDARGEAVLFEARAERRIVPLLLGSLSPLLQPMAYRLLGALGTGFMPEFSLTELLLSRTGYPASRAFPRLLLGEVVLMRATWRVPADSLPPRAASEARRWRDLRAWARDHGLPRQAYVVPRRLVEWLRDGGGQRVRRVYKPFYVDFDSPLSVRVFDRYVADADGALTISEALPAPARGRVATEYVFETWLRRREVARSGARHKEGARPMRGADLAWNARHDVKEPDRAC